MFSCKSVIVALAAVAGLGAAAMAANTSFTNPLHKHNMNNVFPGSIPNGEICVPCHAPHNTQKDLEALWNHQMPDKASYTLWDGAEGLDMVSRMCLSCHDGTVAVDSFGTKTGMRAGTHFLKAGVNDAWGNDTGAYVVGSAGNLKHDHPVGVAYPGWDGTAFNATTGRGFKDPTNFCGSGTNNNYYTVVDKTSGSTVTTTMPYTDGTKNITLQGGSMFFSTVDEGGVNNIVGCGTCHTPHTATFNFLHIPNNNSQLCLTCHDK